LWYFLSISGTILLGALLRFIKDLRRDNMAKIEVKRSFTTDFEKKKKAVWAVEFGSGQELLDQVIETLTADVVAKHFCYGFGIDDLQRNFKPVFDKAGKLINKPKALDTLEARLQEVFGSIVDEEGTESPNYSVSLDVDKNIPDDQLKMAKKLSAELPTDITDEEEKAIKEAIAAIIAKR
jgi:hypothetical protein